jgi:hypothetical protein
MAKLSFLKILTSPGPDENTDKKSDEKKQNIKRPWMRSIEQSNPRKTGMQTTEEEE